MRVVYDGVAFQNGSQRGVQRAFRELIAHLPAGVEARLTLLERPKAALPERASVVRPGLPAPDLLPRGVRRSLQPLLGRRGLRREQSRADVFHSTYETRATCPVPSVFTVHDLILERFSEFCAGRSRSELFERRRRLLDEAARVIAISRSTADELERFYPGVADKTRVVHWGWGHLGRTEEPAACPPPETEPYALVVGDRAAYKNFRVVLDALEGESWPAGVGLVVAGPPWGATEAFRVGRLGRKRRVRHAGRPDDSELARLYANAACVISPSLMEGFGFPVLEAQAAGAPLVCSDLAVYREVAGEGAVRFEPHRPDELGRRVGETLESSTRERLIRAGRENLKRFSWERCAAETVTVYEEAAATR